MLEGLKQEVPPELRSIAREVEHGRRGISKAFLKKRRKEDGKSWSWEDEEPQGDGVFTTWDSMNPAAAAAQAAAAAASSSAAQGNQSAFASWDAMVTQKQNQ